MRLRSKQGRSGVVIAAAVTATWLSAATPQMQARPSTRLALVGGMLLTGYEVPPIHHAAVLIENDKIVAAGPASEIKIPSDATVLDTSGRTMLPGLIDTHAHLIVLGHGNYATWFRWINQHGQSTMLTRVMEISARQLLMAGVTTAVDLGAPLQESLSVRDRINKGEAVGSRVFVSGPWLQFGRGPAPPDSMQAGFGGLGIATAEEAEKEAERLAVAGVDHIKAHSGLSIDHYKAIVRVARKHRIRVHAHVYGEEDVRNALDAGVDVLQHVGSAGTAPPYTQDLITRIVNTGRPVVVTAAHRSWIYPDTAQFPERLQDPGLKKAFGPDIYAEVQGSLKNWHSLGYFQRTDREMLFRERGVKQFIEAGAVIGIGTDSGTPMNFHSEALWREIKVHADMGMTPIRAIAAATRINAQIIGKGRELGSIEPGSLPTSSSSTAIRCSTSSHSPASMRWSRTASSTRVVRRSSRVLALCSRARFHMSGDLLGSCEPDPWLGLHVCQQVVEVDDAGTVARHIRMQRQHHHRAFAVGDIELVLINLEDQFRRRKRSRRREIRFVIENSVER